MSMEGRCVVNMRSGCLSYGPLGGNLFPKYNLQEKINTISTQVPTKQGEHGRAKGTLTLLDSISRGMLPKKLDD